jgi:hypothetical protein
MGLSRRGVRFARECACRNYWRRSRKEQTSGPEGRRLFGLNDAGDESPAYLLFPVAEQAAEHD